LLEILLELFVGAVASIAPPMKGDR